MIMFGVLAGIISGLLGIGGGLLVVPALTMIGLNPVNAVGTSMLTVLMASLSGTISNWRSGTVTAKAVIPVALPAVIMAPIAGAIAGSLDQRWLLLGFGIFAAGNIFLMSLRRRVVKNVDQISSESKDQQTNIPKVLMIGGLAGFFAGLFGVGGGVILVPLLVSLCGMPIKIAISTSLGVIMFTAIAALSYHSYQGHVVYETGLLFGAGGFVGAKLGTKWLVYLSETTVQRSFILLMVLVCVFMIYKAL
jgi:uncharacterized membrane protein YfcA